MSLPERLAGAVDDEDVVASVSLGGDDVLVVTPTRTLVYRAEGLLSDETVEEYSHDVERVDLSQGRRKAKLTLEYGLDGTKTLSLPTNRIDDVLHPVLAGILSGRNVTTSGESVLRTFRFSELTLIITSHRLVKHIGPSVWDEEFEEFAYEELTGLDFEEGTVATAVVLTHAGRSERFKAPNESARAVRETLTDAVCEFHDVDSLEEFRLSVADDSEADESTRGPTDFGNGPDPLSTSPVADAEDDAAESSRSEIADEPVETSATVDETPDSTTAELTTDELTTDETADELTTDELAVTETTGDTGGSTDPLVEGEGTDIAAGTGDSAGGTATESSTETDVGADDASTRAEDAFEDSPFESAGVAETEELSAEVAALRDAVERQSEQLDRQTELIERLIEELRRGR